jgi:hypothetical protein
MRLSLLRTIWLLCAIGLAWGINQWRSNAAAHGLEAARDGDREAGEEWIDRALRESQCTLHEAEGYLSSDASRSYVRRSDYVQSFVERLYSDGAALIEICESDALGFRIAQYLLVTLPEDVREHEQLIADAQSLVRRDAVVYRGVSSVDVEEIVRVSSLVGTSRLLVELPAQAE